MRVKKKYFTFYTKVVRIFVLIYLCSTLFKLTDKTRGYEKII